MLMPSVEEDDAPKTEAIDASLPSTSVQKMIKTFSNVSPETSGGGVD